MLVQEPQRRVVCRSRPPRRGNYYWQGTPLILLYDYYLNGNEENHDYAVDEAGKAAGRLLKEVLINYKRTFETEEGYTRMYRWKGEETNK